MPAAARVGDMTSHGPPPGTPLTPLLPGVMGSSNVLIGGKPAWRAQVDVHVCPLTSPQAHVGGTVLKGSTSVFINGMPAARQEDIITESGGGPNRITIGCSNVLIGG